jgi:hypothetical protein
MDRDKSLQDLAPLLAVWVVGDNPWLAEVAAEADARLRRVLSSLEAVQAGG